MSRRKVFTWTMIALVLLIFPIKRASAQSSLFVEEIYPQQVSRGTTVEMLVRGGGFESVRALDAVVLNGQSIPIMDWAVLSDDVVKIQLSIPENARVGETEITFVFDDIGMDAFFIVTERDNGPFIEEFYPQDGMIDTEVPLSFAVSNYDLGSFGGITIGNEEIPVNRINVNDTGEAWEFLIYLPTYLPPGDSVINLYFQTYTFSSYFYVYSPEMEEPLSPSIYGYDPNEAPVNTDVEFTLQGYVLPELGDLRSITIGDVDLPINYYSVDDSNEIAVAGAYLPPEIPPGEAKIIFYYDSYRYADTFYAISPEEPFRTPVLRSVSPMEVNPDSDVTLFLSGENLDNLGEINDVRLGDFSLPFSDYYVDSPNTAVVDVYIPEDAPQGTQFITISFENAELNTTFLVTNEIPLWILILVGVAAVGVAGVVVVGGGIAVIRALRKGRTPREKPRDEPRKPHPDVQFKVGVDFGTQTIEPSGRSLTRNLDIDIRFEVSGDPGEQHIEPEDDSLVDKN